MKKNMMKAMVLVMALLAGATVGTAIRLDIDHETFVNEKFKEIAGGAIELYTDDGVRIIDHGEVYDSSYDEYCKYMDVEIYDTGWYNPGYHDDSYFIFVYNPDTGESHTTLVY